jgi:hypothetical protein
MRELYGDAVERPWLDPADRPDERKG